MRIPKSFNPRSPAVPPRPGLARCAPRPGTSPPERARQEARPEAADDRGARSPGCARRCAPTPATAAPTARTTPAGPSAATGCCATASQLRRRIEEPDQHHRPHLRPDRARVLTELDYLRGDAVTERRQAPGPALRRAGPARQPSACARGVGGGAARPSWPPACRRWCSSPGSPTTRWRRRCPSGKAKAALGGDGPHLGPARRPGGGLPDQPDRGRRPARARPRLRLGGVHGGPPAKGLDEVLREVEIAGRRLRALVPAGHRRPRPDRPAAAPGDGSASPKKRARPVDGLLRRGGPPTRPYGLCPPTLQHKKTARRCPRRAITVIRGPAASFFPPHGE